MPATFATDSVLDRSTRTNSTIVAPTGIQDGDGLVIVFEMALLGSPPTPTPPTGFLPLSDDFPVNNTDGSFNSNIYVWGKPANGESGDYLVTHSSAISGAYMLRASGAALANTFLPEASIGQGGGNPATAPGLTLPINGYLVLWWANYWDPGSVTPPTGFTSRYNPSSGTGLHTATGEFNAGPTGDALSVPPGSPWSTGLVAIAPFVAAGTGGIGGRFDDWF